MSETEKEEKAAPRSWKDMAIAAAIAAVTGGGSGLFTSQIDEAQDVDLEELFDRVEQLEQCCPPDEPDEPDEPDDEGQP